jgi:hypothetical protein
MSKTPPIEIVDAFNKAIDLELSMAHGIGAQSEEAVLAAAISLAARAYKAAKRDPNEAVAMIERTVTRAVRSMLVAHDEGIAPRPIHVEGSHAKH